MLRRLGSRLNPDVPGSGRAPGLVASAARIKRSQFTKMGAKPPSLPWQDEAWSFYDTIGELRSSARWKASSLSRVTLFIAEGDTDVPEPKRITEGPAVDYLNALFNGPAGQAQMLAQIGLHFTIPGELYLVSYKDAGTGAVNWVTASNRELVKSGTDLVLDRGDGKQIKLTDDDWILRIWKQHPRQHWAADSPTRASLPVLRELEALGSRVSASNDSRLAGNGVLLLPKELDFPQPENKDLHDDPLMGMFIEAMVTPIKDRDSAAAIVPIILQAPGEHLKNAQWLHPDSKIDDRIDPMREKNLQRLAIGMDMPQEALLGMGGANHWAAWLISEEGVKLYVEPDAATICDALTTGYLWPLLEQDLGDKARDLTIWYDVTGLTERPDRGPDADIVWDRGELSGKALRKYRGFSEDDAPTEAERRERILLRIAETHPDLAVQILESLGIVAPGEIAAPASAPQQIPSQRADAPKEIESGDGGEDDRSLPDEPGDTAPAEGDGGQSSVIAIVSSAGGGQTVIDECVIEVAHLATVQVLDWAGRRLLKRSRAAFAANADVRPAELHTHIALTEADLEYVFGERLSYRQHAQAWGTFGAAHPELASVVPVLDRYVRQLMLAREPHCRAHLVTAFKQAGRVIAHA